MVLDIQLRVARNIRRCREASGLTQGDLAKRLDVTIRYVNMLERQPRNLSLRSVAEIAKALDVPIEELICDEAYLAKSKQALAELGISLLERYLKKRL